MRAMTALRVLGPIDARTIQRDSFLGWLLILPFGSVALFAWGLPFVTTWLAESYDFDLSPYHALIISYMMALVVPLLVGQVLGFMLLDERDNDTLRALFVTPLPVEGYLAYRIGVPMVVSIAMASIAFQITGLVPIEWRYLVPITLLYALEAPMMTLVMVWMCENKVQGMAFGKGAGIVPMAAALSYFVDAPWQYLAGILPPYWPLKAIWIASEGDAGFWPVVVIGLALHVALLGWLLRRFRAQCLV